MISSVNFYSSKISEHVDYHLKPIVPEISSYVKEINNFLCKWKHITKVPENLHLVTLDEKLVYTSIPNCESIKVVKLSHKNFKKKKIATKVITTFSTLILTLKNFILNSKYFLQIKGCAMGTIYAPSYANTNIFIDYFEWKHIYLLIEGKPYTYIL